MDTAYVLSAERVHEIFIDCLFRDGEDTANRIVAEGIMHSVGFYPERLESHRDEIVDMLGELPAEFNEHGGGGWSFLNACMTRHGSQWADLHQTMDELFMLGIAIDKVAYQLPREMWGILPGGMPYLVVRA